MSKCARDHMTPFRRLLAWLRAERDEYRFWAAMVRDLAEADALRAEARDDTREPTDG